jgi:hypothetical protein
MKMTARTILGFILAVPMALAAQGVAFFSDLKGEVLVDGGTRPNLLAELSKGQKVSVGRDAQASVMFTASGKEYVLKGAADYVVKDTEIAGSVMPPLARSTEWRTSARVLTQVAHTSAASVRMRSIGQAKGVAIAATFPAEGGVATLQPTFRWRADDKGPAEFTLLAVGQEKPVHSAAVSGGTYRLPSKLRPDTEYAWTATAAGNEIGAGKFRTITSEALARVEKRRPGDGAEFSDRLHFTLLLQEVGATQEARESWARLAQERADLPELSAFAR